jgi:hypothetical protein
MMPFAEVHPAVVVAVTLLGAAPMLAWRMRETNGSV